MKYIVETWPADEVAKSEEEAHKGRRKGGGWQTTASLEEQEERKRNLQTQGRKGCKLQRINVALTPDNMDYLHLLSKVSGRSMTKVVNAVLAQHKAEHINEYEQAQGLIESLKLAMK